MDHGRESQELVEPSDSQSRRAPLPIFWETEIKCRESQPLGCGSFCEVWAVESLRLKDGDGSNGSNSNIQLPDHVYPALRQRLARRFPALSAKDKADAANRSIYGKQPSSSDADPTTTTLATQRMVMKKLRKISFDSRSIAEDDLTNELQILQILMRGNNDKSSSGDVSRPSDPHPNIIELYGMGIGHAASSTTRTPSFLLLRRLRTTLESLLHKWRDQRGLGLGEAWSWNVAASRQLWLERLLVVRQVCQAICFVHEHRILYRDLKPENVGMDENNVVKLFDFGLAKELPSKKFVAAANTAGRRKTNGNDVDNGEKSNNDMDECYESYHLTGDTGTLRYMAPEVGLGQPYGYGVDVYGLAILIHQILSLKTPFANVPPSIFEDLVWGHQAVRPPMDANWPPVLMDMLPAMWQAKASQRPTAAAVSKTLECMLRGSDSDLFPVTMATPPKSFFSMG